MSSTLPVSGRPGGLVTFGEIMLRLSPPGHQRLAQASSLEATYGGGEANVAAGLAGLGLRATHVTCLPDNPLGHAAARHFRQFGVELAGTVFRGERLGLYFLETGASLRASQVVYDRAHSAFAHLQAEWFAWDEILRDTQWLHWTGITPAISAGAAQATREAIAAARARGLTVSADVNYRRNLWQYGAKAQDVMPGLVASCDVIVCSEGDAADLFGIEAEAGADNGFASVAAQLLQRFPQLKQVLATKRKTQSASHERIKGMLFDAAEGYLQTPYYDLTPVVDRIGGGDAFLAGFLYGCLQNQSAADSLAFATAASALKHTIPGDINLVTPAEVRHILAGNITGRLLR
ncbi:sugar kinase [Hymenobacter psychrophilus]|uniref:2-dehydro-3-deoxygluconokinase n=1 Tax=Hymenobacter psychrophilus TaxID=651662 RepID=A0A1H3CIE7_9BACT|nr:sugar kinase [Hymenobacter psychrophilus]SDX54012.1 2-dehydro-3-deoxygluconokinase [Hymenobacter psychrophilus]